MLDPITNKEIKPLEANQEQLNRIRDINEGGRAGQTDYRDRVQLSPISGSQKSVWATIKSWFGF